MAFISVSSIFFFLLLLPPSLQLVGAVEAEFISASPHVVDTGQVSTKSLPRMFFCFCFCFCHFCHMGVTELGQAGTWNFFRGRSHRPASVPFPQSVAGSSSISGDE